MVKKKKKLHFQNQKCPKRDQQGVKSDQLIKISKNLTKLVKNKQVGLIWPSWSWVTNLVHVGRNGCYPPPNRARFKPSLYTYTYIYIYIYKVPFVLVYSQVWPYTVVWPSSNKHVYYYPSYFATLLRTSSYTTTWVWWGEEISQHWQILICYINII